MIAAVDGAAFGAGFGLALAADMIVANHCAQFCMAVMKVGLVPDFAALYTLPRVVGLQRAQEIIYSARIIDGAEAVRLGIALETIERDALVERAHAIVASLADRIHARPAGSQRLADQRSEDHARYGTHRTEPGVRDRCAPRGGRCFSRQAATEVSVA